MPEAQWNELRRELDRWAALGRGATLWCRDDDAFEITPALERLLEMSARENVPVGLAVIPLATGAALAEWLERLPRVQVLVHGVAHVNHAPPGEKKAELGAHRPVALMLSELAEAWRRLTDLFGERAVPLLVPPWNRIAPALVARLTEAGLSGVSTYLARASASPAPGVRQTNCHVDIIDWRGSRGFVGEVAALELLLEHLRGRRLGQVDDGEPTGVLSHHKDHDEGCWAFLARLWSETGAHPAARWLHATEAIWPR